MVSNDAMAAIRDVTSESARREALTLITVMRELLADMSGAQLRGLALTGSEAQLVQALPTLLTRTMAEHLVSGSALVSQGLHTSLQVLSRSAMELLFQFEFVYDDASQRRIRASQLIAGNLGASWLVASRMAPGTEEHGRHGASWESVTGGLRSGLSDYVETTMNALQRRIGEDDEVLGRCLATYLQRSKAAGRVDQWYSVFKHGTLRDLAKKTFVPTSSSTNLELYESVYRYLSLVSHGGDVVVQALGEQGLRAPHSTTLGSAARALDVFLGTHLRFMGAFAVRILDEDDRYIAPIVSLHDRKRALALGSETNGADTI